MSEQKNTYINNLNDDEKNIKVYENDEAYMLGDNNSNDNSNPNEDEVINSDCKVVLLPNEHLLTL